VSSPAVEHERLAVGPRGHIQIPDAWQDVLRLTATFTFVAFLLRLPPTAGMPTLLLIILGLVHPTAYRSRAFWAALMGTLVVGTLRVPWLSLDNHNFLQLYWVAAIALCVWTRAPERALAVAARLLVGLAFLFAVLWKFLAPDFLTGGFFEVTALTDVRLGSVLEMAGLVEPTAVADSLADVRAWADPTVTPDTVAIAVPAAVRSVAPWLAWGTVLIESTVAVTFLAPLASRWRWTRDVALLGFVVLTYPLAPVLAFGQLLIAMSLAQSELEPRLRFWAYASAFLGLTALGARDSIFRLLGEILARLV
jgi:hypothetical protein